MAGWRGLVISNPASLSLKRGQIHIAQDSGVVTLPPEDMAYVIFDTHEFQISGGLLSAFAKHGIAVILTDEKHIPNGMVLPFATHFKSAGIARRQIAMTDGLKGKIWRKLIKAKIRGQAFNMVSQNLDATMLYEWADNVNPHDPDNFEARAARHYWEHIMPVSRNAEAEDIFNIMLNYGYAIVRSVLSRHLTACGLLPMFGVHHDSSTNAFNLSDDLIEPYRPLLDKYVFNYIKNRAEGDFKTDDKRYLASFLNQMIDFEEQKMTILNALQETCESFVRCMTQNSVQSLHIPDFERQKPHKG